MSWKGGCLVGQSGGPTCVINASLYGVIDEARRRPEIEEIYGALYGIEGILQQRIVDLGRERPEVIEGLKVTPGAALGGCRYRLQSADPNDPEVQQVFELFERLNIRYFFYIGGNDSMDTALKIDRAAQQLGYKLRVMGIPKTVDNDLPETHHCPGYGSAAKYVATSVREAGLHTEAMYTSETVTVLVTVGRNAGWLPAASALARMDHADAPHLICFPEIPFSPDRFLGDVEDVFRLLGGAFIVSGEGLVDEEGNYLAAEADAVSTDPFGHPELGGVGEYLERLIEEELGLHTRVIKPDICQQCAMHIASLTDRNEGVMVGRDAVRYAVEGHSGEMVTLVVPPGEEYRCTTGTVPLEKVANVERRMPREWINDAGNHVRQPFLDYVRPLIMGEVPVVVEEGLPRYLRLAKITVLH